MQTLVKVMMQAKQEKDEIAYILENHIKVFYHTNREIIYSTRQFIEEPPEMKVPKARTRLEELRAEGAVSDSEEEPKKFGETTGTWRMM